MKIFFKNQKINKLSKRSNSKFLIYFNNFFFKKKNKLYKFFFKNWRNNKKFPKWINLKLSKYLRGNIKIKIFLKKICKKNYFLLKSKFPYKFIFFSFFNKLILNYLKLILKNLKIFFYQINYFILITFFFINRYYANTFFYFRFEKNIKLMFLKFQITKIKLILKKIKLKKFSKMFNRMQIKNFNLKLKFFQLNYNQSKNKNLKKFKKLNYNYKSYYIFLKLFHLNQFYKKYQNLEIKKIINVKKYNSTLKNKMHIERDAIFFFNFNKFFFLKKKNLLFIQNKNNFNKYYYTIKHKTNFSQKTFNPRKKWFHFFKFNQNLLSFLYFFKKKRSHFLKKFYSNILKKSFYSFFLSLELNLANILLKTRFCITKKQVTEFIKFNYIYVNGISVINLNTTTKISDIIQILYTSFFFKKLLYIKLYYKNISFRIKYCLNRWYKHQFNFYKQRPQKLPSWLTNLVFLKSPIITFCEIDYKTLTIVIIKQPTITSVYHSYNFRYINLFLLRQYNWRLSN